MHIVKLSWYLHIVKQSWCLHIVKQSWCLHIVKLSWCFHIVKLSWCLHMKVERCGGTEKPYRKYLCCKQWVGSELSNKRRYRNLYRSHAIISVNSNNSILFEVRNKILYTILPMLFFKRLNFFVFTRCFINGRLKTSRKVNPLLSLYQEWRLKTCSVKELLVTSIDCYAWNVGFLMNELRQCLSL